MFKTKWKTGPAQHWQGSVVVSFTDFSASHLLYLPGVLLAGLKLRRAWPQIEGAVGMWLWYNPKDHRSGSISVWKNEDYLRKFVQWPPHTAIVQAYRGKGKLVAECWQEDCFDKRKVWQQMESRVQRTISHQLQR